MRLITSPQDRLTLIAGLPTLFCVVLMLAPLATVRGQGLGGTTIYVMNRDGSESRDLLPKQVTLPQIQRPFLSVNDPCWSPDGEQIAFVATVVGGGGGGGRQSHQVMVVDAAGSEPRLLAKGATPDWSPDGKRIAFTATVGQGRAAWLINADGSGPEEFVGKDARAPVFSPDGKGLLYGRAQNILDYSASEVFYFDLRSGVSRPIEVKPALYGDGVSWSPDSKWIVGAGGGSPVSGNDPIFVSMDPSNPRIVTVTLEGKHHGGTTYSWSPDGKSILIDMWAQELPIPQLYAFDVPDLTQDHVTVRPVWVEGQERHGVNFEPAWSPDGERIVYVGTPARRPK